MSGVAAELGELKGKLSRFVGMFLLMSFGLLSLTIQKMTIFGVSVPVPVFGAPTLATQAFLAAKTSLIPEGIAVVALGPVSSFLAPVMMAFLLALLITFPFGVYSAVSFLRPALRPHERQILSRTVIPALMLFYLGCALSYFLIIPQTFAILYSFADPMGVAPLFALDDFILSVFALTVSIGFAFLLPVVMVFLSRIGLVPGAFWTRHFRGALLGMLIFSAIVTPDGSGVTMAFLLAPLLTLYGIGAFLARSKSPGVI
jgi:sec-independent protein translocase protein TatC